MSPLGKFTPGSVNGEAVENHLPNPYRWDGDAGTEIHSIQRRCWYGDMGNESPYQQNVGMAHLRTEIHSFNLQLQMTQVPRSTPEAQTVDWCR